MLLLWFMACGSDKGITIFNSPPEPFITSHEQNTSFYEGQQVLLIGSLSDPNDAPENISSRWYAGSREICSSSYADSEGKVYCDATILEGDEQLILEATDPDNATGSDFLDIIVSPSLPPSSEIINPITDGVYYSDLLISFQGRIWDPEEEPDTLVAYWKSSNDGILENIDVIPDENGVVQGYAQLSEGQHAITLHVEDSVGKTNSPEATIIRVGAPNSAPSCAIITPSNQDVAAAGVGLSFVGEVHDVDLPANLLSVSWASDKDGELGISTPSTAGAVIFSYSDLSVDTHTITMLVTDELGETCADIISLRISNPPMVEILSPTDGTVFSEGDAIGFEVLVSDAQAAPEELTLRWDLDGAPYSLTPATSSGIALHTDSSIPSGTHVLSVTATDTDGLTNADQMSFVVNGLPSSPIVSIQPQPAYTEDNLLAQAAGSVDPEGDLVTYTYEWFKNGTSQGITSASLSAGNTQKHELWTVRVTPFDSISSGTPTESSITIHNTPPEITDIVIAPLSGYYNDIILQCNPNAIDPDELPDFSYIWLVDGQIVGTDLDIELNGLGLVPGDDVTCIVTATDSDGAADTYSETITLENRPPTVNDVMLTPNPIFTNDTVTANPTITDPDGDTIASIHYEWHISDASNNYNDWIVQTGLSNTLDGLQHFEKDDVISVIVTPNDGTIDGSSFTSSSYTVENSTPTAPLAHITPNPAIVGQQDLYCMIDMEASDPDGDPIQYSFSWYDPSNNVWSTSAISNTVSNTLPSSDTTVGTWICTVNPHDGIEFGTPGNAEVLIQDDCPPTGDGSSHSCAASSCYHILANGYSQGDGYYWIDPDGAGVVEAYCDMTTEGGGWSLALQVDAGSNLFAYNSAYWTNNQEYGTLTDFASGLDYKSPLFFRSTAQEVLIELESNASSHAMATTLTQPRPLRTLFATNTYVATNFGRTEWMAFDTNTSLQSCCNQEGFNNSTASTDGLNVRIGILANGPTDCDCDSPDSVIGLGRSDDSCYQNGIFSLGYPVMAGNVTICDDGTYSNGLRNIGVLGRLYIR